MRRHRHNLKPEQLARLMNYLAGPPALEPIYRFKQRLCHLLLKSTAAANNANPWLSASSKPTASSATPDSRNWPPWAKRYTTGATKSD